MMIVLDTLRIYASSTTNSRYACQLGSRFFNRDLWVSHHTPTLSSLRLAEPILNTRLKVI